MKLNPFAWSFRIQYLFGFIVCAALIAYALYADKILGFDACPLCIFQRVAFAALGVVGLLGAAPFTPAIYVLALLLPVAALVAWRGAVVTGLLSFLLCIFAFVISPLPMAQLIKWPFAVAWLVLCSFAVTLGAVHGVRISNRRDAR